MLQQLRIGTRLAIGFGVLSVAAIGAFCAAVFVGYQGQSALEQVNDRASERIGIVLGVPSLIDLFDDKNHTQLPGGILEAFGRLFKNHLKLFVYPMKRLDDGRVVTVDDLQVGDELQPLFDYLAGRGSFVCLDNHHPEYLSILSRDVLRRIAAGDEEWESMVPAAVAELIVKRSFFGFRAQEPAQAHR